jgi:RNA polymerase sigma-54 factor
MALGPRLDLRQSQSLVLTPQLQQAIRLLQLTNVELEAEIMMEVEKNPLLELASEGGEERTAEPVEAVQIEADASLESGMMDGGDALDSDFAGETFHHDSASDGGPGSDGALGVSGMATSAGEDGTDFDSFAQADISLAAHLSAQANAVLQGVELLVALDLIGMIDDAGYITIHLLETANRLGVAKVLVEQALSTLQGFDPTGVGARTLGECLALQAKEADRLDPAMQVFLNNLDLLAEGKHAQLKRICDVDDEDLADMIRELRNYDPKPGLRFGGVATQSVTPDLFVRKTNAGWTVELNNATLPRVLINRQYHAELSRKGEKAIKSWLGDCMASANWLVKALDQRQRTIIRVASEILRIQQGFFESGISHLRPLTARSIAETLELHESTISRATSGKYLSCDRGTFELKFFFTSGIASSDGGENASAQAVKARIKALIAVEQADAILSDDTLVDLLKGEGFEIARRTVAKYREAAGLGSSVQRRRQKAMAARAA